MPRKRARGAGRKPRGPFADKTSAFTTRITDETKRALERAAKKSGVSVSQCAERLLKAGLQKPTRAQQQNRALGHAITHLAENVGRSTGADWREDLFAGLTLRYAIEALVANLIPELSKPLTIPQTVQDAAAKMPANFAEHYRTPEGHAHTAVYAMLCELESAATLTQGHNLSVTPIALNLPEEVVGQIARDLLSRRNVK